MPFYALVIGIKLSIKRHWEISIRSEEHTSELQSHSDLVCRLLLEKKKELQAICKAPRFTQSLPTSRARDSVRDSCNVHRPVRRLVVNPVSRPLLLQITILHARLLP